MTREEWDEEVRELEFNCASMLRRLQQNKLSPALQEAYRLAGARLRYMQNCQREYGKFHWMQDEAPECETVLQKALDKGLRIGAFDTEYYTERGRLIPTEVGISIMADGYWVNTRNFVLEGGKKGKSKKFLHGKTERFPVKKQVRPFARALFESLDLVLVWSGHGDNRALKNLGVQLPWEKTLDVSYWQRRRGHNGSSFYSLQDFCALQGYSHQGAHCAGNDSHSLLMGVLHGLGVLGPPVHMEEVTPLQPGGNGAELKEIANPPRPA